MVVQSAHVIHASSVKCKHVAFKLEISAVSYTSLPPPRPASSTGFHAASQQIARSHGQGLGNARQVEEIQPSRSRRGGVRGHLELRLDGHGRGRRRFAIGDGDHQQEEEFEGRQWRWFGR